MSSSSCVPPQQNHHPHHYQRQQNHHRQHPPSLHNHHHHRHRHHLPPPPPPPPPPVYDQTLIYYGFQQPTPSGFRSSISPLLPQYYYYFYYDYLNDLYYNSQPVNNLLPWTHQRERIVSSSSSSSSFGGGGRRRRRDWVQESRASVNFPMQISYALLDETAVFDLFPEDFGGLDVNNDDCNLLSEETVLKHLKTRKYQTPAGAGKEVEEICVVCQSEYEDEEELGILGCRHEYHASCITRWLMTKNVCPVCKRTAIDQES